MTRQIATQTQQQTPTTSTLLRGSILQRKCESCGQHTIAGGECAGCAKEKSVLQRKLTIGASNDPLEREADLVADQVMAAPTHSAVSTAPPRIQRYVEQATGQADMAAPASVDRVLSNPGSPLDPALQQDMGQRFGHDFSRVRVHTDAAADRSARDVNANAYTVGHDIVFGAGQYASGTMAVRRLLAHELTHVVQQTGTVRRKLKIRQPDDRYEQQVDRVADQVMQMPPLPSPARITALHSTPGTTLQRQPEKPEGGDKKSPENQGLSPETTSRLREGVKVGTGRLQFYPGNLTNTVIGAVSAIISPQEDTLPRLSVIIPADLSLLELARILLPLWSEAQLSEEMANPPAPLTEEELAKGLAVYTQHYLPIPKMTHWKVGLRLPLPVLIDLKNNKGILNPNHLRLLASGFEVGWKPILSVKPTIATTTPDPAELRSTVDAFLAENSTALGRGIALAVRALKNALDEKAFILAVFDRLNSADAFEVALEFLNLSVIHQIGLLSSQVAGAEVLDRVRTALAQPPASLTVAQKEALDRANKMLQQGRQIEISTMLQNWITDLPRAGRQKTTAITLDPAKGGVKVPEISHPTLNERQKGMIEAIKKNREAIPSRFTDLQKQPHGYMYAGAPADYRKPKDMESGDDDNRKKIMTTIFNELLGEGGWSAINTYEEDVPLTWGKGFASVGKLPEFMRELFKRAPGVEDALKDAGLAFVDNKWLIVDTNTGLVEEGNNALNLLRFNVPLLSLMITLPESKEYGSQFVETQWAVIAGAAAKITPAILTWTDMKSVALVSHCIWWRTAKSWKDYESTGGNVKQILHILTPIIDSRTKPDPARGNALFVGSNATSVLLKFASGHARAALKGPGPLPADIATGSYTNHAFFSAGGSNYYQLEP